MAEVQRGPDQVVEVVGDLGQLAGAFGSRPIERSPIRGGVFQSGSAAAAAAAASLTSRRASASAFSGAVGPVRPSRARARSSGEGSAAGRRRSNLLRRRVRCGGPAPGCTAHP